MLTTWEERLTRLVCSTFWTKTWPTKVFWWKELWSRVWPLTMILLMRCKRPRSISLRPRLKEKDSPSTRESQTIERKKRKLSKSIWKRERTRRNRPPLNSLTKRKRSRVWKLQFKGWEVRRQLRPMPSLTKSTLRPILSTMRLSLRPILLRPRFSKRPSLRPDRLSPRLMRMKLQEWLLLSRK